MLQKIHEFEKGPGKALEFHIQLTMATLINLCPQKGTIKYKPVLMFEKVAKILNCPGFFSQRPLQGSADETDNTDDEIEGI